MASHDFPGGFAVLMAVYRGDEHALFERALSSIFANTLLPSSVWIVADGPLTGALESVLSYWCQREPQRVRVHRLDDNRGLAHALNAGLQQIRESWVVRADADDINLPHRFTTLAKMLEGHPNLDLMSSAILEVTAAGVSLAVRAVPTNESAIRRFAARRNPFNHMAVAYRREGVLAAGGYPSIHLKEDYALWCRMLALGARVANSGEVLVHATAGIHMYQRRGGWKYARAEWDLQRLLVECRLKPRWLALIDGFSRAAVFLAPARFRELVYVAFLRQ